MGRLPGGYISSIEDAVGPAGANIESVSVIASPLPLGRIAGELEDTNLRRVDRDNDDLERLGRRIGRGLVQGGELVGRLRQELFSTSRGEYSGLDAVVFVRDRDGLKGDEKSAQDAFENGFVDGMQDTEAQVVGVEKMETDPSQVPFMRSHDITSVDDLDLPEGKAALVWALLGPDGRYGRKPTAERLLPPPPERAPRQTLMGWLPLGLSLGLGALLAPTLLARLARAGVVRENYRGLVLPAAAGILIAVVAALAVGPLAALDELAGWDTLAPEVGAALDLRGGGRDARPGGRPAGRPPAGRRRGGPGRPPGPARPRAGGGAG